MMTATDRTFIHHFVALFSSFPHQGEWRGRRTRGGGVVAEIEERGGGSLT